MINIKDYKYYCTEMSKSLYDKAFFMDKIFDEDIDTIVDFGCADGSLIRFLNKIFPAYHYIGYDNNSEMISIAREVTKEANILFTDLLDDLKYRDNSHSILVLSSVLHEIYSYLNEDEQKDFFDFVFNSRFKYIAIRDMYGSITNAPKYNIDIEEHIKRITENSKYQEELNMFTTRWGDITSQVSLRHFLLKYPYLKGPNALRELNENYMSIPTRFYVNSGYQWIYYETYTLPWTEYKVKRDFDYNIPFDTHFKMILKKEEN